MNYYIGIGSRINDMGMKTGLSFCFFLSFFLFSLSPAYATEDGKLLKKYTFPMVSLEENQQARLLLRNISSSPLVLSVRPNELAKPQRIRLMPGGQTTIELPFNVSAGLNPIVEVFFEDPLTAAPKSFEDPLTARPKEFEDPLTAKPEGFEDPLTAKPKGFEDPLTARSKAFEDPLTAKPLDIRLAIYDSLNPSAQPVRYILPTF